MKPNKYIAVFSLLNALAFCLTHSSANAGQGDKGSQRGGQASFANGEPYPITHPSVPSRVRLDAGSRSSYKGRAVDALAQEADEGRGHLRKGPGSW